MGTGAAAGFFFWREGGWWEEGKSKLSVAFPGSQSQCPSLRARAFRWAPGSGAARGRGQRACSRQPQGTRTVGDGGGAPVAVAGHARLSARLLKYGGGGVKTGAGSRDPCDECDECDRT